MRYSKVNFFLLFLAVALLPAGFSGCTRENGLTTTAAAKKDETKQTAKDAEILEAEKRSNNFRIRQGATLIRLQFILKKCDKPFIFIAE